MSNEPDIDAINLVQRVALLDNGEVLVITRMFDSGGEGCEPEDAVSFIAGPDSKGDWYAGPTSAYNTSPRQ